MSHSERIRLERHHRNNAAHRCRRAWELLSLDPNEAVAFVERETGVVHDLDYCRDYIAGKVYAKLGLAREDLINSQNAGREVTF